MPVTINAGLSRKAAQNYQSAGLSLNITAELDPSLLGHPDELQARIADLYAQLERALEQQAARMHPADQPRRGHPDPAPEPAEVPAQRPATPSQHRAIRAICRRLGTEPVTAAHEQLGLELETLSVGEASQLIGRLEQQQAQMPEASAPAR